MISSSKMGSMLGSILEWYDFAIYGFLAPVIAQVFFPDSSPFIGLIKALSIFCVGFLGRPIGALLFGYIGDNYGRVKCLRITPLLITFSTCSLACLPSFQTIGIAAPILLTFFRFLQGISIGGEYANNIIFLCESSSPNQTYFQGSIGACTGSIGILCASLIASIFFKLSNSELMSWAWRLPFAISLFLGVITYFLRLNLKETEVFQNFKYSQMPNSLQKLHYTDFFIAIGITFLPATAFYFIFMFLPNFLTQNLQNSSSNILSESSIYLLARLSIIPVIGIVCDKIGGIKIARLASFLFLLASIPLWHRIVDNSSYTSLCLFIFALLTTLNAGSTPGLLINFIAPQYRCTALSITFNLSFGIFGGIAPLLGFYLANHYGNYAPIYYLVFSAVITLFASLFYNQASKKNGQ